MIYAQLSSGVFTSIPRNALYELALASKSKVFLSAVGDSAIKILYDDQFNLLGSPQSTIIDFDAGSYILNANFNGSHYAIAVYIPSYESYKSLTPLSSGSYAATSWNNLYKLQLKEDAPVWISANGSSASAYVYDENLNFVARAAGKPLYLASGNYIVTASFNGYKYATLDVAVEQSKLATMDAYQALSSNPPLEKDNDFFGSSYYGLDVVHGLGGNDRFFGADKEWIGQDVADKFFGGAGIDTAVYHGKSSEYLITETTFYADSGLKLGEAFKGLQVVDAVGARNGTDLLNDVERLQFSDATIAFDIEGNAGQAYRIYKAALDRAPDEAGLGYWIEQMDNGLSLQSAAQGFIDSAEFSGLYGARPSDEAFIDLLYQNILNRSPDQAGYTYWVDHLYGTNKGGLNPNGVLLSRADVLTGFSESAENKINVTGLIQNGIEYLPYELG